MARPSSRGVRAVALVEFDAELLLVGFLVLLHDLAVDLHGRDLFRDPALLDRLRVALLALQRVGVLGLALDPVALRHDLGGDAHREVEAGKALAGGLVGQARGVLAAVLHHRDGLDARADGDVGALVEDRVRGHHHGLGARGAEAVDGGRGDLLGETRRHRGDARGVHALAAFRKTTAHDHVLDVGGVEVGNRGGDGAQRVRQVVDGFCDVEGAPMGLGETRTQALDDDGFASHDNNSNNFNRLGGSSSLGPGQCSPESRARRSPQRPPRGPGEVLHPLPR